MPEILERREHVALEHADGQRLPLGLAPQDLGEPAAELDGIDRMTPPGERERG